MLRLAGELGNVLETSFEIQGLAMAAAGIGDVRRAVRVAAAAAAIQDRLGADFDGITFWTELLERYSGPARALLGAEAEAIAREGRRLDLTAAVADARLVASGDDARAE